MKVGEQTFVIFGAEIINVCFEAAAEIRTSSLNEQKWKKTDKGNLVTKIFWYSDNNAQTSGKKVTLK